MSITIDYSDVVRENFFLTTTFGKLSIVRCGVSLVTIPYHDSLNLVKIIQLKLFTEFTENHSVKTVFIGGSKRSGRNVPLIRFLSISCSFQEKLAKF